MNVLGVGWGGVRGHGAGGKKSEYPCSWLKCTIPASQKLNSFVCMLEAESKLNVPP